MSYEGHDRRKSTTLTKEDLADVVREAMQSHLESDQHRFVQGWMEKERRKQEMWEKIKAQVIGVGLVAVLTFLASQFWQDILSIIRRT